MKDRSNGLVLIFGLVKLLIHFFTNTNYALHRDAYLYFDEGKHLSWGYMEVPPLTPFIGRIADLLGGSVFAIRLFPALVGVVTMILAGLLVKKLGGKSWAITFTCLGLIFSPALLGSNTFFQPVSFNQFFWFLSAYFLVQAIHTEQKKFWYFLGISVGLGLLTKYSIVFYGLGMILALLITKERKWLATKYPYISLLIAFLIALPNIIWQFNHNLPILNHMQELRDSQLVNVDWVYYLSSQFRFHFSLSLLWIAGLIVLFKNKAFENLKFVGFSFLFTVLLIGLLAGKPYYTIGAFTILFPFGGIALERFSKKRVSRVAVLALIIVISIPFLPYALPILKIDKMKEYCAFIAGSERGHERWEDGQYYDLPQDYADMHGWEELSQRVAKIYHVLPPEKQRRCVIFAGSYGHAGSLKLFSK